MIRLGPAMIEARCWLRALRDCGLLRFDVDALDLLFELGLADYRIYRGHVLDWFLTPEGAACARREP